MVATVTSLSSASSTAHYFEQDGYYATVKYVGIRKGRPGACLYLLTGGVLVFLLAVLSLALIDPG